MILYDTLPIFALTTHDDPKRVCDKFNIPKPHTCKNAHKDGIIVVQSLNDPIQEGDAMITQQKGLPLILFHADCQVAIFYEPKAETLALVHSGWRGTNLNIYGKVINKMEQMGCRRDQILAVISPSLGPEKSEFIHYKQELNSSLWKYEHRPFYFDFWKIAEDQLLEAGLTNIYISRICTYSNLQFHSYRRDKTAERDSTIAMIPQ